MVVGTVEIRMLIRWAQSLKDKRRAILSLKDRIRNEFDVAVAEVDRQDAIKEAVFGVAAVGPDPGPVERVLQSVVGFVRRDRDVELVDFQLEWR
jgi:uncharacterized protein YlxP (DUF503 family)